MTIRNALLVAAGLIAVSLTAAWAVRAGFIEEDVAHRLTQFAAGLVVVFFANQAPKTLEPLSGSCSPTRVQAFQRFSGWILVLGGLGYSLVWLVVSPVENAAKVSIAILASSVVIVLARLVWMLATRRRGRPSAEG